jgi:hypothetical protein
MTEQERVEGTPGMLQVEDAAKQEAIQASVGPCCAAQLLDVVIEICPEFSAQNMTVQLVRYCRERE